jgi:hypothetical protein
MSHIYSKTISFFIPSAPAAYVALAGSATVTFPKTGSLWYCKLLAGGGGAQVEVQVAIGARAVALACAEGSQKGFCLRAVDFWYYSASNVTTLDVAVYTADLQADGAAFEHGSLQAGECSLEVNELRILGGYRKLTYTLTSPFWLRDDQACYAKYLIELGAAGEIYLILARARGDLRL